MDREVDGLGEVVVGSETHGLDAQPKTERFAVVGFQVGGNVERGELVGRENGFMDTPGLESLAVQLDGAAQRNDGDHLHRLAEERTAHDHVWLELVQLHRFPSRHREFFPENLREPSTMPSVA